MPNPEAKPEKDLLHVTIPTTLKKLVRIQSAIENMSVIKYVENALRTAINTSLAKDHPADNQTKESKFKVEISIHKQNPKADVTIGDYTHTYALQDLAFAFSQFANHKPDANTPDFLIEHLNKLTQE